jgi:thioredoxin reductase (NADPH)
MPEALHRAAVARGAIRYCPVCDGYEVIDRAVAVVGSGEHGMREAEFLRAYTGRLALIAPYGAHDLNDAQRRRLDDLGVAVRDGPTRRFSLAETGITVETREGALTFDSIYPAMGSEVHSDLARALDARLTDLGCIVVDTHQRTRVPGLYVAGDVVAGLDQISHAMGEAGVAATTIRNDLCAQG